MSVDLAHYGIFRAKVGKGGINIGILCIFTAGDANIIVTDVNAVSQIILKYDNNLYNYSWRRIYGCHGYRWCQQGRT